MTNLTCNPTLRQAITQNLQQFTPQTFDPASGRQAAVALTIIDSQAPPNAYNLTPPAPDQASLILTRRSFQLKKHAGQWALPGGRIDPGETPEQTALRELEEEVGLHLDPDRIIGRLDDFRTRSGFIMTPIVVWGGTDVEMERNPAEVESIHRIPCQEFLRKDAPILQSIPDSEHPVLLMPIGNNWIAAPTGAILYQFREVALLGRDTRVAHYEQPYFAWR